MKDFRELLAWQKAHRLVLAVYKETQGFPTDERYGLTAQLRRAAVSISSNLAEGCGRGTDRDFGRFVQLGMGSASEVEYQLLLANELNMLSADSYSRLHESVTEIKRMLAALIRKLNEVSSGLADR